MLSYIADTSISNIIQNICKRKNILILNAQEIQTDLKQYIKETKVNFNLTKYLIIDLSILSDSNTDIIESIYNFSKLYNKTRIIILALDYDEQNIILTNLYELGFYNIINESETEKIENKLITALSENGIQKNESRKFKKREEVVQKESKIKNIITNVKPKESKKVNRDLKDDMPTHSVYLFSLLLEAITILVKFICYLLVFGLTSVGLTIMLNQELRDIAFQIFGLK